MVSPRRKGNIAEKLIFAELIRYIVDHMHHIHVSFVHTNTNAIEAILRVGVVSQPSKSEYC